MDGWRSGRMEVGTDAEGGVRWGKMDRGENSGLFLCRRARRTALPPLPRGSSCLCECILCLRVVVGARACDYTYCDDIMCDGAKVQRSTSC